MSGIIERMRPEPEGPVPGETGVERSRRSQRNRLARQWWAAVTSDRCSKCGEVRFHVSHEMDPEHSLEGPEYHRDIAHHPFLGAER